MGHINSRCENKWWTYLKAAKTTWVSTPKEFERLTLRPSLLTSYIRCSHLLFRSLICQCKCSANIADGIWTLARIQPVITHRENHLVVTLKAWLTRSKSAKILQLLLSKSSRTHKEMISSRCGGKPLSCKLHCRARWHLLRTSNARYVPWYSAKSRLPSWRGFST